MVPPMPAKDRPQHVILVGFDGLSGKCIRDGIQAPTIRELMANGSYTLESRSILPSSSACNWASMFMGAGIEVHGYTVWNSKEPDLKARELTENGRFPDIFWAYKKKDPSAEIGYIYEWDGMNFVSDPAATDYRVNTPATNTVATAVNYIKEQKPGITGVLADPVGSTMGGGEHSDYDIEGIGNDFIPDTMDISLVDRVVKITDTEAFENARLLARREGIFAGSSSGGALAAALKLVEGGARGNIVAVFPDRGDRYFSKGLYKAPAE